MTAAMTSIFNGRWPEMSSFNIFIKTSHFDHLFFFLVFKQTNLCNSLKYSFSLQWPKYININSTVCIREKKKKNTHMPWTCTEHTGTHMVYWNKKGIFLIGNGRDHHINFQELRYRNARKTQKDPFVQRACFSLDFTVNYVGKTVFIYQIQTQKEALENYQMNIQLNLQ